MAMRVGINGFGRIGRLVLRAAIDEPELELVAINDVADVDTLAYLLQFDSVHGLMDADVELTDVGFTVDGQEIRMLAEREPDKLPWRDLEVDLVIEASGRFTSREKAQAHLEAGASKVLITAPAKEVDGTFVIGVNAHLYDPDRHDIISTASCTTNTLAVVLKVLQETFGVERGFMTTVHAYTNSQVLLDKASNRLRRSRAAAINLVPTSTGAARTIDEVMPEMAGRIGAMAVRSPNAAGSLIDLVVLLGRDTDAEAVNDAFEVASEGEELQDILLLSHDPLVSTDIVGTSLSAIVDAESTMVNGNMAKVLAWYDNEWGYSCRVADMAVHMAQMREEAS